jgi:hypothetical protein
VMRARVPDCVVQRTWWRGGAGPSSLVSMAKLPRSDAVGILSEEGRRCMVEGKWPVWKVDLWRRRVPFMLFGSVMRVRCL